MTEFGRGLFLHWRVEGGFWDEPQNLGDLSIPGTVRQRSYRSSDFLSPIGGAVGFENVLKSDKFRLRSMKNLLITFIFNVLTDGVYLI